MYLPTALFVNCLIALNFILPHGSGAPDHPGANHQQPSCESQDRRQAWSLPCTRRVRGPFCVNLFFAESADSRNLKKQQRVALAAQFILRRT